MLRLTVGNLLFLQLSLSYKNKRLTVLITLKYQYLKQK